MHVRLPGGHRRVGDALVGRQEAVLLRVGRLRGAAAHAGADGGADDRAHGRPDGIAHGTPDTAANAQPYRGRRVRLRGGILEAGDGLVRRQEGVVLPPQDGRLHLRLRGGRRGVGGPLVGFEEAVLLPGARGGLRVRLLGGPRARGGGLVWRDEAVLLRARVRGMHQRGRGAEDLEVIQKAAASSGATSRSWLSSCGVGRL
mmetsp:Transcript_128687/g.349296  ORF Transcript_128687/g.349296 Transcript_128687/m.349296 type:complete len:201 (-) Transcript_128687:327-929(-)